MKAAKWYGAGDIRVEEAAEPKIIHESDALVAPTSAMICGTDLTLYNGDMTAVPGGIVGHEFMGVVKKVGAGVKKFRKGDRVVVSAWIADGTCWFCRHQLYTQCVNINIFGMGPVYGESLEGAFTELVRVPHADTVLIKAPENMDDEKLVAVSDSLPTAYEAIVNAGIRPGDTVAVIGCGPIGLLSGMCAQLLGASHVICVDVAAQRLDFAKKLGFETVNSSETDAAEEVRNMTDGVGADLVVEAVGKSREPLLTAIETARRKGTVSVVGFHLHEYSIPSGQLWLTEKKLVFSIGDPIKHGETLIKFIESGRLDPAKIITHTVSLDQVPYGFELFAKKQALKVLVKI